MMLFRTGRKIKVLSEVEGGSHLTHKSSSVGAQRGEKKKEKKGELLDFL